MSWSSWWTGGGDGSSLLTRLARELLYSSPSRGRSESEVGVWGDDGEKPYAVWILGGVVFILLVMKILIFMHARDREEKMKGKKIDASVNSRTCVGFVGTIHSQRFEFVEEMKRAADSLPGVDAQEREKLFPFLGSAHKNARVIVLCDADASSSPYDDLVRLAESGKVAVMMPSALQVKNTVAPAICLPHKFHPSYGRIAARMAKIGKLAGIKVTIEAPSARATVALQRMPSYIKEKFFPKTMRYLRVREARGIVPEKDGDLWRSHGHVSLDLIAHFLHASPHRKPDETIGNLVLDSARFAENDIQLDLSCCGVAASVSMRRTAMLPSFGSSVVIEGEQGTVTFRGALWPSVNHNIEVSLTKPIARSWTETSYGGGFTETHYMMHTLVSRAREEEHARQKSAAREYESIAVPELRRLMRAVEEQRDKKID